MSETQGENAPKQWYTRGFGGLVQEQIRIESSGEPDRFFLKAGEQKRLTFVDDEPFQIHEHQFRGPDGRWGAHVTCLKNIHDDTPCCEKLGERTRGLISFTTIVNIDGYTTKKGVKAGFQLQLLALKYKGAKLLEQEKADEVTLIGRNYRFSRTNGDANATGDSYKALPWNFKDGSGDVKFLEDKHWAALYERVSYRGKKLSELIAAASQDDVKRQALGRVFDLASITDRETGKLIQGRIPPFNYAVLLEPRSPKEVAALVKGAKLDDDEKTAEGLAKSGSTSAPAQDDTTF
jgi:hypothetical protein